MTIFWSPSVKGFYDNDLQQDRPDDCKAISADLYQTIMSGQAEGKIIASDSSGLPVLRDPPAPSREQLESAARMSRDKLLRDVYDIGIIETQRKIRMAEASSLDLLHEHIQLLDAYAVALQDVPEQEGFPDNIIWPEPPIL